MGYRLDLVAENLIHALCEFIVLRQRLLLAPETAEAAIEDDVLHDLARGLGLYCGLAEEAGDGPDSVSRFIGRVSNCLTTRHLVKVFREFPKLEPFLMAPYFSPSDLHDQPVRPVLE
jgi:hypothetical protein